jgi:hypothetical protein
MHEEYPISHPLQPVARVTFAILVCCNCNRGLQ